MQPARSGWCLKSLAIAWVVLFLSSLLWPDDAVAEARTGEGSGLNETCGPLLKCGRYPSGYV
jgi:hypothetical protein